MRRHPQNKLEKRKTKKKTMSGPMISYRGELVNLANVIYARPLNDSCIKLCVLGSAGAGHYESYDIQHREINLHWPHAVWDELCKKAGVIFSES